MASEKAWVPNIHANPDQISTTNPRIANSKANSEEIEEDNPRDRKKRIAASKANMIAAFLLLAAL